jgi:hypothetical protein
VYCLTRSAHLVASPVSYPQHRANIPSPLATACHRRWAPLELGFAPSSSPTRLLLVYKRPVTPFGTIFSPPQELPAPPAFPTHDDERLVPDLLRGRGRSIGRGLDIGEKGSEQMIVTLQSLHHDSVGYQRTRTRVGLTKKAYPYKCNREHKQE